MEFEEEALRSIARKAIERETGARGLRSILENLLTEIMYDVPSNEKIERCIITKETVEQKTPPALVLNDNRPPIIRQRKRRRTPSKVSVG